jgi:uncharacterized protein with HEPN domain
VPPRDLRLRVEDILEAIADVTTYVAGLTFEQFSADRKTIHAVLHNLQVIGEAARHIGDEVELRYPDVPWAEMRDMRNVLAHEYFGVDLSVVWETIRHDLPPVATALKKILGQL